MDPVVGVVITASSIASVGGVGLFVFNGTKQIIREIRETVNKQTELLHKMDEHLHKMDEHLVKIDEHLVKIDEHLTKIDEHLNKIDEHLVKMDERTAQIAQLIVEESRANRELIERLDRRISQVGFTS